METVRGLHGTYRVSDTPLNKGGVGAIHATDDRRLVYKAYHSPDRAPRRAALDRLIEIGRDVVLGRGGAVGDSPESSVNWPLDVVPGPGGRVRGVILPAIPPALFNQFGNPRTLEFLIMARACPPAARGRMVLLLRMAEILAFLDEKGLVHGDINGRNLAWCEAPEPMMYLIDCDGIVPRWPAPTSGVQALGWTDPRVVDRIVAAHDHYSDRYALALAMYRGLLLVPGNLTTKTSAGGWPKPSRIPDRFDDRLVALLRRALDDPLDAESRPAPAEWVAALLAVYLPDGRFDEAALRALDRLAKPGPAFVPIPPQQQPAVTTAPQSGHSFQAGPATYPPPPAYPLAAYPRPTAPPPLNQRPPQPFIPQQANPSPPGPAPGSVPGWFADRAVNAPGTWHAMVIVSAVVCGPVAPLLLVVTAVQAFLLPVGRPGRTRVLRSCAGYALIGVVFAMCAFFGN